MTALLHNKMGNNKIFVYFRWKRMYLTKSVYFHLRPRTAPVVSSSADARSCASNRLYQNLTILTHANKQRLSIYTIEAILRKLLLNEEHSVNVPIQNFLLQNIVQSLIITYRYTCGHSYSPFYNAGTSNDLFR